MLHLHKQLAMTYDLIEINNALTEPITLVEAKAYLQIDADYASNDTVIALAISTARIRLEQYLNVGFIKRDVTVQWNGNVISLPLYPNNTVNSVKLNSVADPLEPSLFSVSRGNAKKIGINSVFNLGFNGNWFYSLSGQYAEFTPNLSSNQLDQNIYTVTYNTGFETLPLGLKQALLAETSYIFNLHGMPITDVISKNAALLASGYSKNLVL